MPKKRKNAFDGVDGVTEKQDRFCREYLIDFNGAQAAIRAGYSEKSARMIALENLTKPYIKAKIEYYKANVAEALNISALTIAKEHQKIAFANGTNLWKTWITLKDFDELSEDVKACIQEVSYKTDRDGNTFVKVKLYDKQKSLDSLTAMTGFNAPVKTEVNARVEVNPFEGVDLDDIAKLLAK